jgi:hypothetical protein
MTRQRIILCLSFLLTAGQCLSQGLELELTVRPALTSLRGNDVVKDNFDPTVNFSTGIGLNYFLKNNSIINFGILYDKKGGRGKSNIILRDDQDQVIGEGTLTNEANFDYITVPIQWGRRFGQKIKYQFGIGLYTSFILKQELISKGLDGQVNTNENNTDKFKTLDFGLSASFNVFIPFNDKLSIKVGLDNNLGLINTSDVPVSDNGTIKHNSLGLSIGLNYRMN